MNNIGAAQLVWIILNMLGLGIIMARHGKPKTDKYNFFSSLLAIAINFGILYWGGFFR